MKQIVFLCCLLFSTFSFASVCPQLDDITQDSEGNWHITKPLPPAAPGASWSTLGQNFEAENYHILAGMTVIIGTNTVYCMYWAYPSYYDMLYLEQSSPDHVYAPAPGSHFNAKNRCDATDPADCAFVLKN